MIRARREEIEVFSTKNQTQGLKDKAIRMTLGALMKVSRLWVRFLSEKVVVEV